MLISIVENKDILLFILVISLIFISVLMVYLVYTQNKQLTNELIKKDNKSNEMMDLKELSKQLEKAPKKETISMTPYEAEQEEKAIISYDELLKTQTNVSINYLDKKIEDNIEVKQIDLENTGKIELDPIKKELNTKVTLVSYEHEEEFLKSLKKLQYMLHE